MRYYTFTDGHITTSKLGRDEILERMRRLDWLIVLTEGYERGVGLGIHKKALRAYDKTDNFTGIIHLTLEEKDFIGYMLESDMLTDRDRAVLEYYLK